MGKYRLNIDFTGTDLKVLYDANEQVILVKHTAGSSDSQVAWVSFNPFMLNTIDWETNFALYASNTKIQSGATINKLSDIEAMTQATYEFSQGIFQNETPNSALGPNTYGLINKMPDYPALTFGLAQSVVVNNEAFANHPINALYVPLGQSADMTPIEKVDVYLMSNIDTGTVVSHIASQPITVTYSGSITEQTICYDGQVGKFYKK